MTAHDNLIHDETQIQQIPHDEIENEQFHDEMEDEQTILTIHDDDNLWFHCA